MVRCLSLVIGVLLVGSACTGGSTAVPATTTAQTSEETAIEAVVTPPPVILDVAEHLALTAGQCWSDLPTPQPATSVSASETVAVVDCGGSSLGLVYSNGCLAVEPSETLEPVVTTPCPGRPDDRWPGLRELRPAAVTACLPQFESGVGERYATSELEAIELLPTEEQWALGDRRFVCTAQKIVSSE